MTAALAFWLERPALWLTASALCWTFVWWARRRGWASR